MPALKDLYPVIDDRRYADLVAEARTRIPRYTPEWTDLNESDPGMALVELFAWMTELLMYRLGKVPQLNYLKFLELVGFELHPARAAVAEISFPVQASYAEPYVLIPKATQVATDKPDELGPVIFETDRALIALTAQLDAVQVYEPPAFRDVSTANEQRREGFDAFGPRAAVGGALLLGFRSTLEFPEVEINLAFWAQPRRGMAALSCAAAERAVPDATIVWEHWDGKGWSPLDLIEDKTMALARSGHVRVQAPPVGRMKRTQIGQKTDAPRFWIRARLKRSNYQVPPRLLAVRANTAAATQAETIQFEILGGSDGRPDQVRRLTSKPVLDGSLVLEVDEGEGFTAWTEVGDFFGSGRDDAHYVLNRATGEARFGDGKQGRIPVANANRPANLRARRYRIGGGKRGNVDAGRLNGVMSAFAGVDVAKVGNPFPSAGGADDESLAEAKKRAAVALKSRDRAVVPEDFELLASRAGNIARARVLPLHHPEFPGIEVPGVVSVVVVPDVTGPAPTPTDGTIRTVCSYLNARRLLTTEVFVLAPKYRTIQLKAQLIVRDDADLAIVKRRALDAVTRYFHPLEGGEDSSETEKGTGWPFGGDIYYSLVVRRLLVEGVKRVARLTLKLGEDECPACCDVALEAGMLLMSGDHEISVHYDGEEDE
jgi:predicted phage baseplate assembly protein